jgi:hypothetical protein
MRTTIKLDIYIDDKLHCSDKCRWLYCTYDLECMCTLFDRPTERDSDGRYKRCQKCRKAGL